MAESCRETVRDDEGANENERSFTTQMGRRDEKTKRWEQIWWLSRGGGVVGEGGGTKSVLFCLWNGAGIQNMCFPALQLQLTCWFYVCVAVCWAGAMNSEGKERGNRTNSWFKVFIRLHMKRGSSYFAIQMHTVKCWKINNKTKQTKNQQNKYKYKSSGGSKVAAYEKYKIWSLNYIYVELLYWGVAQVCDSCTNCAPSGCAWQDCMVLGYTSA